MAEEDYTTYTETDIPGKITVESASKISWVGMGDLNNDTYVTDDKGAGFFSGDFVHGNKANFTKVANGKENIHWAMKLADGAIPFDSNDGLICWGSGFNSAQDIKWQTVEHNSGTTTIGTTVQEAKSQDRYFVYTRDEAIGSFGQLDMDIYSDVFRTTLVGTSSITLTEKANLRWMYAMSSHAEGSAGILTDGSVENLDLTFVAPELPASISRRGIGRGIMRGVGRGM